MQNDNNNESDVFVFDRNQNSIKRVSISSGGDADGPSYEPSISSDGRYIAFSSWANNLVEHDTTGEDVFIYDQILGITERVSVSSTGEESDEDSYNPSISGDGRYVAFVSGNAQVAVCKMLLSFGDNNNVVDIFVHDRVSKTTKKVSVSSTGEDANENSDDPAISGDGHYVAFSSYANNLVQGYDNYYRNIFVYYNNNNLSSIYAVLYPKTVKSGDQITVKAYSPNSISVNVRILGNTFKMGKRLDGLWYLDYVVSSVTDGVYDVLVIATDSADNQEQINLNFTVDNTPPMISATVTPTLVKSGDRISIDALTSKDTINVTALILGERFDLYPENNGWKLYYWIPQLSDGNYPILLTATDKAGNQNTTALYFTADNTPPVFSGSVTPDTVKTYDNLTITATSDSDTTSVSALILNQTYHLTKLADGTWTLQYTVPYISDGSYSIILTAKDISGNMMTFPLSFNVFNPLDNQAPVVSGTVTHTNMINRVFPSRPCIYFQASSDPDVISATASVLGNVYILNRQEDGTWASWYFDWLEEGSYTALLTAQDWSGNHGNQTINFSVVNIIPTITPTVSPTKLKSGDNLILTVNVNPDPWKVYVYVSKPSKSMNLEKQTNGSWLLNYTVPTLEDGYKTIYITCLYGIGWFRPDYTTIITAESSISFIVDNTPPNFSVFVTPSPIKSSDTLKIGVSCTTGSYFVPDDTVKVTATVFGNTFNLNWFNKWSDWFKWDSGSEWNIETIIPNLPDGIYPVLITATDDADNQNTKIINLTIDNTPPTITAAITPNKFKYIDFSRPITSVMAQSSSDTKEIHAYLEDGSENILKYSNNQWILQLNFPYLIPLGNYVVKLKAFDYAGNEAESSLTYYVYQNLNVKNPLTKPSEPESSNNKPVDGSSSTESSSTGSSTGSSNDASTGSADESTDPNDGTPLLKLILEILLILGDVITIFFCIGFVGLLFWALFSVIGLLGLGLSLLLFFLIAIVILGPILVIILTYYMYNRPKG